MEELKRLDYSLAYDIEQAEKLAVSDKDAATLEVLRIVEQALRDSSKPVAAKAYVRFMRNVL